MSSENLSSESLADSTLQSDESSGYDSAESEHDSRSVSTHSEDGHSEQDSSVEKESEGLWCDENVKGSEQPTTDNRQPRTEERPSVKGSVKGYFTQRPFGCGDFDVLLGWQWGISAEKKKTTTMNRHEETDKDVHKLSGSSFSHGPKIVGTAQGRREDAGIYVGFANLPNQVHRKSVKRGFEFTLMVIGESGLGKSTLVDSLFLTTLYSERQVPNAIERIKRTVSLTTSTVEIEEKGVKLKLTVVDTPGIGDAVDTTKSWMPIVNYINDQYEAYLKDESGLNRRNISDNRVHCCLYFVNAAGHGLKPLDIAIMKDLHDKVNIVPVIAKADTLTKKEVKQLKERILREIQSNEIQIYQFPEADDEEDDEEFIRVNKELKASVPFAVVGSNTVYDISGKKVRGRIYPWGVVDIENPSHCDFTMLRNMLIRTHMQDLKDVTQDIHYENFRAKKLQSGTTEPAHPPTDRRPEQVDGRDALLREKEAELKRMQEMIEKMQASMLQQQQHTEQQQQQNQQQQQQQQILKQQTTNTSNGALPQVTT